MSESEASETKPIDHREKALSWLPETCDANDPATIAIAQVHATLAVADEMRELENTLKEIFFQIQHVANGVNS